ncbi:MAG: CBS domain-containing protein [Sulfuricella sp.]
MIRPTLVHLISAPLLTLPPEAGLIEAAERMSAAGASAMLVAQDGRSVGLLTERDVLLALAHSVDPHQALSTVMSTPVNAAPGSLPMRDAYHLLVSRSHRHLLVTDEGGAPLGIVDESDFRRHLGMEYLVKVRDVKSLMTSNVLTLPPNATVGDAAVMMERHHISCVVVAEACKPLGIITERDMVGLYRLGAEARARSLAETMKHPVIAVAPELALHEAAESMRRNKLRRLVVVDGAGDLAGILTEHDLLKRLEDEYLDVLRGVIREQAREIDQIRHDLDEQGTLDLILDCAPELAVVAVNPQHQVIYANVAARSLCAWHVEPGDDFPAVFEQAGFPAGLYAQMVQCAAQDGGWNGVADLPGPRHLELHAAGLHAPDGEQHGLVFTCRDVSTKEAGQRALQEAELTQRLLLESAEEGICGIDSTGVCTFSNSAAAQLLGLSGPDVLVGHRIHDLAHYNRADGTPYPRENCPVCETYTAGSVARVTDEVFWRADGSSFAVEYRAYPIWREGRLTGAVMVFRDRTAEQRTLAQLQASEARLRTLIETIPDLVWLKDPQGVYLACNPAFERFFGAKEADIVGKTDYDYVARERADFFRANDQAALAAGHPSVNEEWITFAADGRHALLQTTKTPMRAVDGQLIGVLGIGRDITEFKRHEAQLTQQLDELRRWHEATLGRETRVLELKREVNELLRRAGEAPRYGSVEPGGSDA